MHFEMRLNQLSYFAKNSMSKFLHRLIGYLPYFICFGMLLLSDTFQQLTIINGTVQMSLFILVVCIPAYRTKRMSYVDIGWPWGLVCIGLVTILFGEGFLWRKLIIGSMYMIAGLRMGVFAVIMWRKGHLNKELNRYQFQRKRWAKKGFSNQDLSLQYEIMIQGFANVTFLAIPAYLQSQNPTEHLSVVETLGYLLWLGFIVFEHVADLQKSNFTRTAKRNGSTGAHCNVGLWKFSRHPNYFGEWMVWNALIITTIPSLSYFYGQEYLWIWILLSIALIFISRLMYLTLVFYTGAVPSEYYSMKKRPGYTDYQKQTNRFFPGPKRTK